MNRASPKTFSRRQRSLALLNSFDEDFIPSKDLYSLADKRLGAASPGKKSGQMGSMKRREMSASGTFSSMKRDSNTPHGSLIPKPSVTLFPPIQSKARRSRSIARARTESNGGNLFDEILAVLSIKSAQNPHRKSVLDRRYFQQEPLSTVPEFKEREKVLRKPTIGMETNVMRIHSPARHQISPSLRQFIQKQTKTEEIDEAKTNQIGYKPILVLGHSLKKKGEERDDSLAEKASSYDGLNLLKPGISNPRKRAKNQELSHP